MQGILRVKQNGEKNVAELCSVTWWKIFRLELPNWHCVERVINPSSTIQTEVVFTIDVWVGLLFVLCAGILGAIIVELLYNKADWFLTPLVNKVVRRYHYTINRNRYDTMNGHP